MSHKKNSSMIHVPFSWEKRPGVPKFITSPMHIFAPDRLNRNHREVKRETALPLPSGSSRNPVRSVSKRMFVMEEDPFVAAMITCTKDCDMFKSKGEIIRKSFGTRVRMSKFFMFSCKHSFDVKECNLSMKTFNLGSIVCQERVDHP
ncbi:hypothetical protein R6Q57_011864 [Mikania cordata]